MQAPRSDSSLRFNKLLSENLKRDLLRRQVVFGSPGGAKPKFGLTVKECVRNARKGLNDCVDASDKDKTMGDVFFRSRDGSRRKGTLEMHDIARLRNTVFKSIWVPQTPEPKQTLFGRPRTLAEVVRRDGKLRVLQANFNDYFYDPSENIKNRDSNLYPSRLSVQADGDSRTDSNYNEPDCLTALFNNRGSDPALDDDRVLFRGLLPESWTMLTGGLVEQPAKTPSERRVLVKRIVVHQTQNGGFYKRGKTIVHQGRKPGLFTKNRCSLKLGETDRLKKSHWMRQVEAMLDSHTLRLFQPDYYDFKDIRRPPPTDEYVDPSLRLLATVYADIQKFVPNI